MACGSLSARRAWIEITVCLILPLSGASLSARRAWIEICRNRFCPTCQWSLSARRAGIEIKVYGYGDNKKIVALRKESVDRNLVAFKGCEVQACRSPQGERG